MIIGIFNNIKVYLYGKKYDMEILYIQYVWWDIGTYKI